MILLDTNIVSALMKSAPEPTVLAWIDAISRSRGAALATRNVSDFAGCGVEVVNPWGAPP